MADEQPSLHIDTDWKKQAQEEKRRLAEQEKTKAEPRKTAPTPFAGGPGPEAPASSRAAGRAPGSPRETPPPSFAALTQSIVTQILFYLGDLAPRGTEPQVNLDMAKYQIDILGVLEEKTKNNLSDDEKHLLDAALYEVRMRYVNVAAQYVT